MRPRWRSRGDGRTAAPEGQQRERRTAAAELVVARGMTARGQGKKVGGAVAGQGRTGARPARKRGRIGGFAGSDGRERRWRSASHRHVRRRRCIARPLSWSPRPDPARCTAPDADQIRPCRLCCRWRAGVLGWIEEAAVSYGCCTTRSYPGGTSASESKDAISASGALNRPRLNSGGTIASTASSFSERSMRR